jgi:anti-sigma-K factor RskA
MFLAFDPNGCCNIRHLPPMQGTRSRVPRHHAPGIVELADAVRTGSIRNSFPHWRIVMVVTSAHIPAIVALIAGVLILIMPRLLNLVVAIYLICIGLIGLGALKLLHL